MARGFSDKYRAINGPHPGTPLDFQRRVWLARLQEAVSWYHEAKEAGNSRQAAKAKRQERQAEGELKRIAEGAEVMA